MDIWFNIFYKTTNGTPNWWWKTKSSTERVNAKFKKDDLENLKIRYQLNDVDIKFLVKYNEDDVKDKIKKTKKTKNSG